MQWRVGYRLDSCFVSLSLSLCNVNCNHKIGFKVLSRYLHVYHKLDWAIQNGGKNLVKIVLRKKAEPDSARQRTVCMKKRNAINQLKWTWVIFSAMPETGHLAAPLLSYQIIAWEGNPSTGIVICPFSFRFSAPWFAAHRPAVAKPHLQFIQISLARSLLKVSRQQGA